MTDTVLEKIVNILKNGNYETLVLENFSDRRSKFCFDILAKKEDLIFSIKIFPNIDNLNPDIINDIKSLSLILKSKPILIGIRNRYQKLEDNTIYVREELPFISFNTLENILNKNLYPYILTRRGGGVIFLDGNLMKIIREKHLISRKELSERLGVAKRTICSYENETMCPSENIADQISRILENSDIYRKINLFKWNFKFNIKQRDQLEGVELSPFESHVQDIIKDIGISTYWYKKGLIPFKLSIYSNISEEEKPGIYPLFSGVSEVQKKLNQLNLKCLKMFTNLFHKNALFIVDNNIKVSENFKRENIPIVKIKDLEEIDDEEEFIELIQEL